MTKKLKWQLGISFFILVLGTLWHFIYSTYPSAFTAFIAPTSESPWQHLKLLYWPAMLGLLIAFIFLKERRQYLAWSAFGAIISGCVFIILFFFFLEALVGHYFFLDIVNFVLASFLTGFLFINWVFEGKFKGYGILVTLLFFSFFFYYLP